MSSYSCNLNGECEEDGIQGLYQDLPRCQRRCVRTVYDNQDRIVIYTTLAYDLINATQLAPSERVGFLRQEFGIIATPAESKHIIIRLYARDYAELYKHPSAREYLDETLDRTDLFLARLFSANDRYHAEPYPPKLATNWDIARLRFHNRITYRSHYQSLRLADARTLLSLARVMWFDYLSAKEPERFKVQEDVIPNEAQLQLLDEAWPWIIEEYELPPLED